jgi:tetratricopeptide (TPR) repeat protein
MNKWLNLIIMKIKACLIFIVFISFPGFAQQETDSLLKKANFELYEHPDAAIKTGINIIKSEKASRGQKIDALLLVSTAYSSTRNYAKSLEYAVLAAKEIPKVNDDEFKVNAYSRLGVQYQQLKVYNKAHSYLDKAITIANNTKQKFDYHKLLGFNYAIRGLVYKEQMSCDIALNYFNKSLYHQRQKTKNLLNYANMSVIVYNKGNCFLSLGKIDSAQICYTNAYRYADKMNANSLRAFANKGLAEVKTYEGQYATAIALLLEAEKMSAGVGDVILNQGIYKGLSDNYLLTNEFSKYEFYHLKYLQTTKRIDENNTKTLNQFILQIDAETNAEIKKVKTDSLYYQIPLAAIAGISILILGLEIGKSKRKFGALKLERSQLEGEHGPK